jgi:beta-lactamase superfamily II metal-dependent hydrolase
MLSRRCSRTFGTRRVNLSSLCLTLAALVVPSLAAAFTPSGLLEIHHINVQQGDCTLIIGPDGTTVLIDGGNNGKGTGEVVPYLQNLGLMPADGIDYMIATHGDADHLGGLDEVIDAGYDVHVEVWDNGTDKTTQTIDDFKVAAAGTSAGPVTQIPLGTTIALGGGAVARCVAVQGNVLGFGAVPGALNNENDLSVAMLVQHGGFDYVTAGDLGGGDDDAACTGRSTSQVNVETTLATSLLPGGGAALLTADGVEVLDVNHHGSESSTNSEYMNLLTPSVAAINVGAGQGGTFHHPRIDVVEKVLMAQVACVTAAAALVLQTEEGSPTGSNTSFAGYCAGDIVLKTSGAGTYEVTATGAVSQGPDERVAAGIFPSANFDLDGGGGGGTPLVVINEIMQNPNAVTDANGEWLELYNAGTSSVDIGGWTVRDDGTDSHVIAGSVVIPAGGYAVLGRVGDPGVNGGYAPDYVYSSFTLANADDEVVLVDGTGATVDRVDYTGTAPWPNPTGASMELIATSLDNNVGSNWTLATVRGGTYTGAGDLGTPGAANGSGGGDTTPPTVAVSAPNGGESWDVGTVQAIVWSASDNVGVTAVDILYSASGAGGSFTSIAAGEANDGTYAWTVPNDPATNAFVKVIAYDAASNSAEDVSNAAFSITVPAPVIVINEIMADPNAVSDTRGEWVELHNPGVAGVDINGWMIRDDGSDSHLISKSGGLVVPAGGYVVLGRNGNSNQNGRYSEDYVYSNFTLANTPDEVVLLDDGLVEVDRVDYTGVSPWPSPTGASMELISAASDNNLGGSWDVAVLRGGTFTGSGDLGTPGAANSVSGGSGPMAALYTPPALDLPLAFELGRNAPNPFIARTSIRFAVPERAEVRIEIFDLQGRRVSVLQDGLVDAGIHDVGWNGTDASGRPAVSGVYFVRMRASAYESVRRIMLAR